MTNQAGLVRGKPFQDWVPKIARLKRAGQRLDALVLLEECIDAAERVCGASGCPASYYYVQAAIIHRALNDLDAEIAVLERYLRVASARPAGRPAIEARLKRAWFLKDGTVDATLPPPAEVRDWLQDMDDSEREQNERQTRQFTRRPPLADANAEAARRARFGLPNTPLDKARWRTDAVRLAGGRPEAITLLDAMLAAVDQWGVLNPDPAQIAEVFEPLDDAFVVDMRTGETLRRAFEPTELWLSARTGLPPSRVEDILSRLQPGEDHMVCFWRIPGDFMEGKIELRVLDKE